MGGNLSLIDKVEIGNRCCLFKPFFPGDLARRRLYQIPNQESIPMIVIIFKLT